MKLLKKGMMMESGKNIILCSDGTGNKGGYGADSNVYKLYKAIDIRNDNAKEQFTFYDNGVGTQSNKIIKAVSGAFGFGLQQNVIDLYTFLASNYSPGDSIYLFGFSRGAATVRAFAGFVQICGLVNRFEEDGKTLKTLGQFNAEIKEAFDCYKQNDPLIESPPISATQFKRNKSLHHDLVPDGNVPIKFIGAWDTVSALGFTPDWKWLFGGKHAPRKPTGVATFLQSVVKIIFPHKFYNYQLNQNVEWAYHALSTDDERLTFKPRVWREEAKGSSSCPLERPQHIEQVWFSGVHASVGGGYPRTGLSDVALDWMFKKASFHGIRFHQQCTEDVEAKANAHGKLYDSRDGLAMFYRYTPRNITELCLSNTKIKPDNLKLHKSAFSRMKYRTGGYAPGELPAKFSVVEQNSESEVSDGVCEVAMDDAVYSKHQSRIQHWVDIRLNLYYLILNMAIALILGALWCWQIDVKPPSVTGSLTAHAINIGEYFLPEFLENIFYLLLGNKSLLVVIVVSVIAVFMVKKRAVNNHHEACEYFRNDFLQIKEHEISKKIEADSTEQKIVKYLVIAMIVGNIYLLGNNLFA